MNTPPSIPQDPQNSSEEQFLTSERKALLNRILSTAAIARDYLTQYDSDNIENPVHYAILAFTMIQMDTIFLLTGNDPFLKALKEVSGDLTKRTDAQGGAS